MSDAPTWVGNGITAVMSLAALAVAISSRNKAKDTVEVGEKAVKVAEGANKLARGANRIAEQANNLAKNSVAAAAEANDIARAANQLSERANELANEALQVSKDAAESSRTSAAIDRAVFQREQRKHHEDMRPALPARLEVRSRRTGAEMRRNALFVTLTLDHDYRVEAEAVFAAGSTSPLGVPSVFRAGHKEEFYLEPWLPDQKEPKVKAVRFRFWPASASDGVDGWSCGCGEPEIADGGAGHWEREVPVWKQPRPKIIVAQ